MENLLPLKKVVKPLFLIWVLIMMFFTSASAQDFGDLEITNLRIPGTGDVICLVEEVDLFLEFDTVGNFPEGTEFRAYMDHYFLVLDQYFLGSSETTSISLTFPDSLAGEGPHSIYVNAFVDGELVESPFLGKDVFTEIDPEVNPMGISVVHDQGSQSYNSGDTIVIEPHQFISIRFGQQVENIEYKLVHVDTETSVSDWKRTIVSPAPLSFVVEDIQEGEYRFFARTATGDGSVVCQDSVELPRYFIVKIPSVFIANASIPGIDQGICIANMPDLSLEFEQTGTFPEGTEIRAVAIESTNMEDSIILGVIEAGAASSIPLVFPADLITERYDIYAFAYLNDSIIEQTAPPVSNVHIVQEIDTNINLNVEGDTSICPLDTIVIIFEERQLNTDYKLVHVEADSNVTEWLYNPDMIQLAAPVEGTYQLFARSAQVEGVVCQDSVEVGGQFAIIHSGSDRNVELSVRLDEIEQEPDEEGVYEFCADETVVLVAPNIEGANYFWYRDGQRLENINENASGISVFEDRTDRTGTGDYHVRIVPVNQEECAYISDTVSIKFQVSEITSANDVLIATEGLSYTWYREGLLVEDATDRTLVAEEDGAYQVEVEITENCIVSSEWFFYPDERQEADIVNLRIPGPGFVICLVDEPNVILEFDTVGVFPEGTEFRAYMTGFQGIFAEYDLGSVKASEGTSITLTFPDSLALEGSHFLGVSAYLGEQSFAGARMDSSIEVYTEIDPEVNPMVSIFAYDDESSGTYESGDTILINPSGTIETGIWQNVENIDYKLVHVESQTSITDWRTTVIGPYELSFAVQNPQEGEYRFFARTISNDGSVTCQDSVMLPYHFVVVHPYPDADIINVSISGAGELICFTDSPDLSLEFEQTGTFPEGTEIRAVAESDSGDFIVGSIEAGTGSSMSLSFSADIPSAQYLIYTYAYFQGSPILRGGSAPADIIQEIDSDITLSVQGDTSVCPGEPLRVTLEQAEGVQYTIVHVEGDSSVVDWVGPLNIPFTFKLENPKEGTYKVFARGTFEEEEGICQDSVEMDAQFTIRYEDAEISIENNVLMATEGSSYQWYKDGSLLENENSQTLIAEESGMYQVEVEVREECFVMSEEVQIIITSSNKVQNKYSISVFPNPADDHISVDIISHSGGQAMVKVVDLTGTVMMERRMNQTGVNTMVIINTSSFKSGIYFIQVVENDKVMMEKFVKK